MVLLYATFRFIVDCVVYAGFILSSYSELVE